MCKEEKTRASSRAFFTNLAGPESWTRKLQLLLRNNWLKLKYLQNCCGIMGSRAVDSEAAASARLSPNRMGEVINYKAPRVS